MWSVALLLTIKVENGVTDATGVVIVELPQPGPPTELLMTTGSPARSPLRRLLELSPQ